MFSQSISCPSIHIYTLYFVAPESFPPGISKLGVSAFVVFQIAAAPVSSALIAVKYPSGWAAVAVDNSTPSSNSWFVPA